MSGKFNMDDYVDVAARIAQFNEKYPEGSLQAELTPLSDGEGVEIIGWFCKAKAYRTPDDTRPGIGHAVEPVPGRTPYTKDSEAMNAETSAWGRAIIALGFPTKKIASRNEVQNRQETAGKGLAAPKSWPKVWEMVGAYDAETFRLFELGVHAVSSQMFDGKMPDALSSADGKVLLQKAAGAAIHLREQFDPGSFPPPTVDDIRACFARVLDGQELAFEGEDDKTPLETTGS